MIGKRQDVERDEPGVRLPPPLIFGGFLVLGLWFDSPWFDGSGTETWQMIAGGFFRARTHIEPWKPTTTILTKGPYAWSRNPIYLGMAGLCEGIALMGASWGALVAVVPAVLVVHFYVIAREERYLEAKFGKAYLDYKQQVRTWL